MFKPLPLALDPAFAGMTEGGEKRLSGICIPALRPYVLPHQLSARRTSPMNIDLSGKTALVTGSTGGIGFAVARGLAACGARIAVNGRKQETVDAALAKIKAALPKAKLIGVA